MLLLFSDPIYASIRFPYAPVRFFVNERLDLLFYLYCGLFELVIRGKLSGYGVINGNDKSENLSVALLRKDV